jgi:hypothetical protein
MVQHQPISSFFQFGYSVLHSLNPLFQLFVVFPFSGASHSSLYTNTSEQNESFVTFSSPQTSSFVGDANDRIVQ